MTATLGHKGSLLLGNLHDSHEQSGEKEIIRTSRLLIRATIRRSGNGPHEPHPRQHKMLRFQPALHPRFEPQSQAFGESLIMGYNNLVNLIFGERNAFKTFYSRDTSFNYQDVIEASTILQPNRHYLETHPCFRLRD